VRIPGTPDHVLQGRSLSMITGAALIERSIGAEMYGGSGLACVGETLHAVAQSQSQGFELRLEMLPIADPRGV
jgi:hypothetical protein